MNYLLVVVISNAILLPGGFKAIPFDTEEHCKQALLEVKKQWSTVNDQSRCIDLEKEAKIETLKDQLNEMQGHKGGKR